MTLIYAFQDAHGHWHGEPDTPLTGNERPSRGLLTYQPAPGSPEAGSPFAGQALTVLYGVTDLEPCPVIYQLDSGGRFQATWPVHTLLATPMGSTLIPSQRHAGSLAPTLESSFTLRGSHYRLTATQDSATGAALSVDIVITGTGGEVRGELRGALDESDLPALARLLNSATPKTPSRPPASPAQAERDAWDPHTSQQLARRFRRQRDFNALAREFGCSRTSVYDHLRHLGLIATPSERPSRPTPAGPVSKELSPLEQRRLEHANTHTRWTETEEDDLARRCAEGALVPQLSEEFGRSPLAIESRLLKIGAQGPAADQARLNNL
ncbi:hypothetical protein ACIRJS_27400 [Streptomyces sp. NPDC102340]|uniref:hypothetical protein n=1 Tax=unclassified Streptomyces TaxID=2593676 RepID=UPI00382F8813